MSDALTKVLEDVGCQEILRLALETALRQNPIEFYLKVIAPRAPKLSAAYVEAEFAELTPAEEAALMDELTTQLKKRDMYEGSRTQELAEARS